jgi:hypothetical protein
MQRSGLRLTDLAATGRHSPLRHVRRHWDDPGAIQQT